MLIRSCETWLTAKTSLKMPQYCQVKEENARLAFGIIHLLKITFKTSVGLQIADETAPAITPAITL